MSEQGYSTLENQFAVESVMRIVRLKMNSYFYHLKEKTWEPSFQA